MIYASRLPVDLFNKKNDITTLKQNAPAGARAFKLAIFLTQ